MAISTNNPSHTMTTEERKLRISDLRDHHQPVLDALGVGGALFLSWVRQNLQALFEII